MPPFLQKMLIPPAPAIQLSRLLTMSRLRMAFRGTVPPVLNPVI